MFVSLNTPRKLLPPPSLSLSTRQLHSQVLPMLHCQAPHYYLKRREVSIGTMTAAINLSALVRKRLCLWRVRSLFSVVPCTLQRPHCCRSHELLSGAGCYSAKRSTSTTRVGIAQHQRSQGRRISDTSLTVPTA